MVTPLRPKSSHVGLLFFVWYRRRHPPQQEETKLRTSLNAALEAGKMTG